MIGNTLSTCVTLIDHCLLTTEVPTPTDPSWKFRFAHALPPRVRSRSTYTDLTHNTVFYLKKYSVLRNLLFLTVFPGVCAADGGRRRSDGPADAEQVCQAPAFRTKKLFFLKKKVISHGIADLEERVAAFPLAAAPPPPPKTGTPLCVRKEESDEVEGPLRTNVSKSSRS